ncbi:conjugal transfer pilus assembly protein TraU [Citrobacter farmeri]|uniref:conjugal transfer pilus assembly protein TraU n=1 Tax=Citrobacter TaxID=544 RepID=UPI000CE67946|nr:MULTISPECIES: conjugal transfer pilus assembly protein TraU [Citrobacter]AVE61426.1 conjugal transfer protein TraU [Citrobacter koseri]MCK8148037.1 conjugal transfer pilus assembly protein TraU [Citrobacter sedlakii]QMD64641.1 conjugal transfer pilus assembly protein TraU [Citrobacter sp. RHB35-C17]HAV2297667.1 conjugal transfer pilus assembly protein TraU [Citrobacter koseri]HBL7007490.1 conjugal transfer pilus assembly protein TraU [Citrobacter koseri]
MRNSLFLLVLACLFFNAPKAEASAANCQGRFVNPITDVCWSCMFPMTMGSIPLVQGTMRDTPNPASPIQICPMGIFYRVGLAIGFWEPMALTDVTRSPFCMASMGGFTVDVSGARGDGVGDQVNHEVPEVFYHVHWYKYPVLFWLNILTSVGCMQTGDMDIGYLSELDPTWNDDVLAAWLTPEQSLFGNVLAQMACAADAVASTVYPLEPLFWCAGAHGSIYPLTGSNNNQYTPLQMTALMSERMLFKLHRQGMVWNSIGADVAVCHQYPSPIVPKTRWRYQQTIMIPDVIKGHPFGASTITWEMGHITPADTYSYGLLLWRKRNCVYL